MLKQENAALRAALAYLKEDMRMLQTVAHDVEGAWRRSNEARAIASVLSDLLVPRRARREPAVSTLNYNRNLDD